MSQKITDKALKKWSSFYYITLCITIRSQSSLMYNTHKQHSLEICLWLEEANKKNHTFSTMATENITGFGI